MKEEDVNQEEADKGQEAESLKVKTNLKAGGDPEPPGAVGDTPIVISGG